MSRIENLNYRYDEFVLEVSGLEFPDQGVTAIVGPSGCGKSTFLRLLCGLEPAKNWSWDFKGIDLAKLAVRERQLGVVFQNYELFPHLSCFENILVGAKARKISDAESKTKNWIAKLGLEKCEARKAEKLSGGEAQRTALARALIGEPRILLLDEPFTALDETTRDSARKQTAAILAEFKIPALLVTHDMRDVEAFGAKIFKMRDGKIIR